jgi:hypothetical protein
MHCCVSTATMVYAKAPYCYVTRTFSMLFNPLNAELNPICHLLALLGGETIVVVSRLRVKYATT